jgi:hypothetical protein
MGLCSARVRVEHMYVPWDSPKRNLISFHRPLPPHWHRCSAVRTTRRQRVHLVPNKKRFTFFFSRPLARIIPASYNVVESRVTDWRERQGTINALRPTGLRHTRRTSPCEREGQSTRSQGILVYSPTTARPPFRLSNQ